MHAPWVSACILNKTWQCNGCDMAERFISNCHTAVEKTEIVINTKNKELPPTLLYPYWWDRKYDWISSAGMSFIFDNHQIFIGELITYIYLENVCHIHTHHYRSNEAVLWKATDKTERWSQPLSAHYTHSLMRSSSHYVRHHPLHTYVVLFSQSVRLLVLCIILLHSLWVERPTLGSFSRRATINECEPFFWKTHALKSAPKVLFH